MAEPLDLYNLAAGLIFVALFVVIPLLGYVFIVLDVRAYLRSLRRGLVRVFTSTVGQPDWYRPPVPPCLLAFGLELPCTQESLLQAYRDRVKELHPDRGGDQRKFMRLQARFEEALALVRATAAQEASTAPISEPNRSEPIRSEPVRSEPARSEKD